MQASSIENSSAAKILRLEQDVKDKLATLEQMQEQVCGSLSHRCPPFDLRICIQVYEHVCMQDSHPWSNSRPGELWCIHVCYAVFLYVCVHVHVYEEQMCGCDAHVCYAVFLYVCVYVHVYEEQMCECCDAKVPAI